jgi:hypothetical protein
MEIGKTIGYIAGQARRGQDPPGSEQETLRAILDQFYNLHKMKESLYQIGSLPARLQ